MPKRKDKVRKLASKSISIATLKAAKLEAHKKELDVIGAVAGELVKIKAELEQVSARLAIVERRASIPGPRGETGERGKGFWR